MTSPPLDSTDNRQHRAWHDITAIGQNTVGRHRAWHNITALGQHTRLDYVRRGMISPPLYSTHERTTSGMACHQRFGQHTRSNDVVRGIPLSPLGSTHGQTTSGVACQHHLWAAQKVKHHTAWHASIAFGQHTDDRHRAWHDITSFGQRTLSNDVDRDMTSPPLESTHG